jgi:hypothetical protein
MKTYWGVEAYIHAFLFLEFDGGELLASCPGRFTAGERAPGIRLIGGWVGPRAGLNAVAKRESPSVPLLRIKPTSSSSQARHYTIPFIPALIIVHGLLFWNKFLKVWRSFVITVYVCEVTLTNLYVGDTFCRICARFEIFTACRRWHKTRCDWI